MIHESGRWDLCRYSPSSRRAITLLALVALVSCRKSGTEGKTEPVLATPVATVTPATEPVIETGPDDGAATGENSAREPIPGVAVGRKGAVTSAEANATDIGLAVLERGGNGIDAAVAVGFALGVTHPSAGNIGGGGFMVIRLPDGKTTTIDYREMAPGASSADMYLDKKGELTKDSRYGPRAAGIPGVVAGLWLAHQQYGSLPWKELIEPSVRLARDGWLLDSFHADDLSWVVPAMQNYRKGLGKRSRKLAAAMDATIATFRKTDGSAYAEGDLWKQPELAETLQAIADGGQDAFYKGALAARMTKNVKAMGGLWTAKDLAGYRPVIREPITFEYRGHQIITMPPPSAGGVVLRQVLAAADTLDLEKMDWDSVQRVHLYIEAVRRTYADRNQLMGDPDFIEIPMEKLLDVSYMAGRMASVDPKRATPSSEIGAGVPRKESEETTHFSVVDAKGYAVANTYTLNGGFGAKVQIPGTGVTLNNEMDDFTAKVGAPNMFGLIQGPQNAIAPGKRMLSSMTPTIVLKGNKLRAILGSPGGPTISTTVAQILLQIIDHDRTMPEAVAAPRMHHQWLPDQIWHEERLAPELASELEKLGHKLKSRGRIGHANCIEVTEDGEFHAVADTGRDGGKANAF
ncbi:MAG: gamma-glutamyltransferase [Myxococcales bacterium]|nr:gamma-glutamyltransferase [Myxococcales bacterium]